MTRGEFAAAPLAAALLAPPVHVAAAPPEAPSFAFARDAFIRRATLPFKHRQVFASRSLGGGVVLNFMRNSVRAYDMPGGFGDGPGSLHVAAVLYGTSLAALIDDTGWDRLALAPFLQQSGDLAPGKPVGNPYAEVVAELAREHASFFVCNNALHDVARALASTRGADAAAPSIYGQLASAVLPVAQIVPAGVAALNALAEYRFSFVQATV